MAPLLWLAPRMTANLAAFSAVTTLYLLAGSHHEEARLREAYGEAFAAYVASGVGFFMPLTSSTAESRCALAAGTGTRAQNEYLIGQ